MEYIDQLIHKGRRYALLEAITEESVSEAIQRGIRETRDILRYVMKTYCFEFNMVNIAESLVLLDKVFIIKRKLMKRQE